MKIDRARLYGLSIPFRLRFDHAKAERPGSDSLVLRLCSGGLFGHGEAVIRGYVTGDLGRTEEEAFAQAAGMAGKMLAPFRDRLPAPDDLLRMSRASLDKAELPVACAVETALLDLSCRAAGTDPFSFLGMAPVRKTVRYGGILPFVPAPLAEQILGIYAGLGLASLRVKLGRDNDYNRRILGTCRKRLGPAFDIRVDVNGAWDEDGLEEGLAACREYGVTLLEEPLSGSWDGHREALRKAHEAGFRFAADESAVEESDLAGLSRGFCSMLNLRLSKNGGLLRVLAMAAKAADLGIGYQLGCHVGETGILSALGRTAACLLPGPLYVDGSFDSLLLSDNVTTESFAFGKNGDAALQTGPGIGFNVDGEKLERLSKTRSDCL